MLTTFVLYFPDTGLYDDIKRAGMDLPLPTPSQCVNVNKAKIGRGVSDQYFANVGMKINVKLGGEWLSS